MISNDRLLALDVGTKRIGIATASQIARLPSALPTLPHDAMFFERLADIIKMEHIGIIVVGMPVSMDGSASAQTAYVQSFVKKLQAHFPAMRVELMDESLTSVEAEAELSPQALRTKGAVDARAAELILERYLKRVSEDG